MKTSLSLMFLTLVLTACQTTDMQMYNSESEACIQYRIMQTAPISPTAYQKLKAACESTQIQSKP